MIATGLNMSMEQVVCHHCHTHKETHGLGVRRGEGWGGARGEEGTGVRRGQR